MSRTMRAAVIEGPRQMRVVDVPLPEPGPAEVRVRLQGSGVCASNLPAWEGQPWTQYPFKPGDLGHEGWGVVDKLGPRVSGLAVGDRVTGLFSKAYAEYDVAPVDHLLCIPPDLAQMPFPAEPLGCAFNIYRRSNVRRGDTVAIIGIGFLGAILTRLAAAEGARVLAISRRPFSLKIAESMGAHDLIPMDDHGRIIDKVKSLTDGAVCSRVIECVGKQWPLDLAGELTAERGTLVIAGYHQDGPRQVNMQLWNWRGLDVVNAHERDPREYLKGMREAIDAISRGVLDPAPLFTHAYPLDALPRAFQDMTDRPDGFLKALVTYG